MNQMIILRTKLSFRSRFRSHAYFRSRFVPVHRLCMCVCSYRTNTPPRPPLKDII